MRRVRGAHAANRKMLAQGRSLMAEARAAANQARIERALLKASQALHGPNYKQSQADTDGI